MRRAFSRKSLPGWRLFTLVAIHLLFAVHVWHWKRHGVTLAPLEFSETLHTLHAGVITLGFLFTLAAILGTLFFGRFFCGWGCHILALQDACAWLLKRMRIRPKPVRSRVLARVPLAILLYMYAWPQVARLLEGLPHPGFRVQSTAAGWGSFATTDLFRAMPGPWLSIATLAVCGFATVYFLGSRGFCYSVCPYGAFFGWADRLSPARLSLTAGCENCGLCTVNCKSGVKVIEELRQFGTVTDPNCLKSMDCVAGCPSQAISLVFGRPASAVKEKPPKRAKPAYDFTWVEEVVCLAAFLAVFLAFRGLYGIGVLMAGGLGAIGAASIIGLRRRAARGPLPRTVAGIAALAVLFWAHSAYVHARQSLGEKAFKSAATPETCIRHLEEARRWSFAGDAGRDRMLALAYAGQGELARARERFEAYLARIPRDAVTRLAFGELLLRAGDASEAVVQFETVAAANSGPAARDLRANAHSLAAQALVARGDTQAALRYLEAAVGEAPDEPSYYCNIAMLHIRAGDHAAAREVLGRAVRRLGQSDCIRGLRPLAAEPAPP